MKIIAKKILDKYNTSNGLKTDIIGIAKQMGFLLLQQNSPFYAALLINKHSQFSVGKYKANQCIIVNANLDYDIKRFFIAFLLAVYIKNANIECLGYKVSKRTCIEDLYLYNAEEYDYACDLLVPYDKIKIILKRVNSYFLVRLSIEFDVPYEIVKRQVDRYG